MALATTMASTNLEYFYSPPYLLQSTTPHILQTFNQQQSKKPLSKLYPNDPWLLIHILTSTPQFLLQILSKYLIQHHTHIYPSITQLSHITSSILKQSQPFPTHPFCSKQTTLTLTTNCLSLYLYYHPTNIHHTYINPIPNPILTQTPSITLSGTNPFVPHCIKILTQIISNKIGSYHFNLINYSYPVKILPPSLASACTALLHVSLLTQIHCPHLELLSLQTSEPSHHRHSPFHGQKSHPLEKTLIIQQPYSTTLKLSHTTTSTNFPSHLPCLKHFILT
jgi:hypothetical protein